LSVIFWLAFAIGILPAFALDLDKVKILFLRGDYKSAIIEGEKLMASAGEESGVDELYYILGLCYLEDGNYLRASDIFEIILNEYRDSRFTDEARLGLGDTYFLRGDMARAEECFRELVRSDSGLKAQGYYRLSQVAFKNGNTQAAKDYLEKLKQDSPQNIELIRDKDLLPGLGASEFYYTVQVGSFSKAVNARNLTEKLNRNGYPAYMEETSSGQKPVYRVRVGKLHTRIEAVELQKKLAQEGYPTRIFP